MLTAKNISAKTAIEYFFKGASQKETSRWSGKGAEKLGLSGKINNEKIFSNIAHGFSLDGSKFLNRRKLNQGLRRSALDFTFSAPKTVSLIALIGEDYRLVEAHVKAVSQSLELVESEYAQTRIRSNGKQKKVTTNNLVIAEFDHIESRELDPHLHTHCLLMNMTQANGKWYSLSNEQMFENKLLLGMAYQSFLLSEIKKLGYEAEIKKHRQFDIKGFSEQQIKAFSKRRQQILKEVGETATRKEKDRAWSITRKYKRDTTQSELKTDWQQQAIGLEIIFKLPAHPEHEQIHIADKNIYIEKRQIPTIETQEIALNTTIVEESEQQLINKINKLSDQELLLLKQNIIDYENKKPLNPLLTHKQLIQNQIEQINNQIQNLWNQQRQYLENANQLENNLFYKWDYRYTNIIVKIEQTAEFINSLTNQKQYKEIELQQWRKQAQIYSDWEQKPITIEYLTLNKLFDIPQIKERLKHIHIQKTQTLKDTANNIHYQKSRQVSRHN